MAILSTNNLKKIYGKGESEVRALDGVDISVEKGEFVAVVGTSGSGKSTLLHMLGGLDRPTEGKVHVDGKDIFTLKDEELTIFRRRKIGFVFQNYNLVPVLNVYENIVLPVQLDGNEPDQAYIDSIIEILGLKGKLKNLPNNLSGGQQQRVAIARALASKPAIILADEPTGNLDSKTSQDVLGLLKVTGRKFAQTIVMITHNEEIAQLADRTIRIEDGQVLNVSGKQRDGIGQGATGKQRDGMKQEATGKQRDGMGQEATGKQRDGMKQEATGKQRDGMGQGATGTQKGGMEQEAIGAQRDGIGQKASDTWEESNEQKASLRQEEVARG